MRDGACILLTFVTGDLNYIVGSGLFLQFKTAANEALFQELYKSSTTPVIWVDGDLIAEHPLTHNCRLLDLAKNAIEAKGIK